MIVLRNKITYLPWSEENIKKYKSNDNLLRHARTDCDGFFAIGKDGELLGYAGWQGKILVAFEVSKDHRGDGLGSLFLKKAIEDGGVEELSVRKNNIPAISLYKKFGFKATGTNGTMIFMKL